MFLLSEYWYIMLVYFALYLYLATTYTVPFTTILFVLLIIIIIMVISKCYLFILKVRLRLGLPIQCLSLPYSFRGMGATYTVPFTTMLS